MKFSLPSPNTLKSTSGKNITIKMYIRVVKACIKMLSIKYKINPMMQSNMAVV